MTSASELFFSRRYRSSRNENFGLGSFLDRSLNHRLNRRRSHRHRHSDENQDQSRRSMGSPISRQHCHRIYQSERERTRLEDASEHSAMVNRSSSRSSHGNINRVASSIRSSQQSLNRNEELPGDVLIARARLLERLRGVSITGNRPASSSSLNASGLTGSDDFRLLDARDWETDWFPASTIPIFDLNIQSDFLSSSQDSSKKKPPGLSQETISRLHREIFHKIEEENELYTSVECCICLDKFLEGDELICLQCSHRFHPVCLDPWIRSCGDCPYCRTGISTEVQTLTNTIGTLTEESPIL